MIKYLNPITRSCTAIALALIATGCASADITTAGSGIAGVTVVDAGCPPKHGATPCSDRPLPARLTVTHADSDHVIAETQSDAAGRFRIALPPGHYVLHASNLHGDVVPTAAPQTCDVRPHSFTPLTVYFDSGVR